jgi:5-methylcytosine-specific restriction enzyme A
MSDDYSGGIRMTVEMPIACITCGQPVFGSSRCPKHRGKAWANRPRKNQAAYSGDWPVLVKQILKRDPWCMLRGPNCERLSVEVDHIRSVADGGTNSPENLRGVCRRCHARRTGQQGARAAKARRLHSVETNAAQSGSTRQGERKERQ